MSASKPLKTVSLDDKYKLTQGRIFITGTQALLRISFIQKQIDTKAGLKTQGYISGYRGSPLGALDLTLWQQKEKLLDAGIVFNPGLNEDLAATAIWGTQQLDFFPNPKVDGVYSMWYGKGPGIDRSADAIRHGNFAGSHKNGGVLLVVGDDHPGKSSTVVNQSEPLLSSLSVPVLYPANVQEIIEFGLLGWQMSRYSGLWVTLKTVNETVEQTQTVDIDFDDFSVNLPERPDGEQININPAAFNPQANEMTVKRVRLPLVHQFVRSNNLNRCVWNGKGKLGIITAGKSYEDVIQAFKLINVTRELAEQMGIGLYKVGCIWPLEPEGLKAFTTDYRELVIVEEKSPVMESQVSSLMFNLENRPALTGKHDPQGNQVLPSDIQLTPMMILELLINRLKAHGVLPVEVNSRYQDVVSDMQLNAKNCTVQPGAMRLPYFCSGCPHNTSTQLPQGSLAMSGIGCHAMVVFKRKDTLLPVHMGGEGINWAGAAPFSGTQHMFQNLGDGTYNHSGLLAIRAAIASGVNITYKILYNDAVAMTGGQPVEGSPTPVDIINQVMAEGVKKCVMVSDQPEIYRNNRQIQKNIEIYHRNDLNYVQQQLRNIEGTTVLLYEQTCAAEKRRRRKRGNFPNPAKRMFINEEVCENCGDCSTQSTCVSILPKDTSSGVKRQLDQSSCNKDYSCNKGFCPSFVTVLNAEPKKPTGISIDDDNLFQSIPEPKTASLDDDTFSIMIAGIGGTGVITVGAVIGMASHLEDKFCSIYDMTGLSQKNGAVYSHLRIADCEDHLAAQRLGTAEADLVLGFDLLASLANDAGITFNSNRTRLVGNLSITPTSDFQFNRNFDMHDQMIIDQVEERVAKDNAHLIDATSLALKLCGDTIAANMFMVGYAVQQGFLPVSVEALQKAIEMNGIAIQFNLTAFGLGRLYAEQPEKVIQLMGETSISTPESLEDKINYRRQLLTDYQNEAYAQRYLDLVNQVKQVETTLGPSRTALSQAVCVNFSKLMTYKDEYEVARLYSSDKFIRQLDEGFEDGYRLKFNLAPPLLSRKNKTTGQPIKSEYGAWILLVFRLLSRMKGLRGTALDLFGYTKERRQERQLINDYQQAIEIGLAKLKGKSADDCELHYERLLEYAKLPEDIRGFGYIKETAIKEFRLRESQLLS